MCHPKKPNHVNQKVCLTTIWSVKHLLGFPPQQPKCDQAIAVKRRPHTGAPGPGAYMANRNIPGCVNPALSYLCVRAYYVTAWVAAALKFCTSQNGYLGLPGRELLRSFKCDLLDLKPPQRQNNAPPVSAAADYEMIFHMLECWRRMGGP